MTEDGLDLFDVSCPYCGEALQIAIETDVSGELVQDCEVCCQPWRVVVRRDVDGSHVDVRQLDD